MQHLYYLLEKGWIVSESFFTHELPNGMMLLGQQMEDVSSAALTLAVPAGSAHDPAEYAGAASVAAEWSMRGAGDRNTRQLNEALDSLGCQHSQSVQSEHIQLTAAQLGRNLPSVLAVCADIVRRPRLEDATFEPVRTLVLQDLSSLEDEPAQKCNLLVRENFFPNPLGRCQFGRADTLQAMTSDEIRRHIQQHLTPQGAILAVAGNINWEELRKQSEDIFGSWQPKEIAPLETTPAEGKFTHIQKDSAQVHIAIGHRTATASDPQYYATRVAETILSGGMSSRLFTEVREKRGLVYHVSSRYHSLKNHAGMFTYAGTTPAKAQETLKVTVAELRRLAEGIQPAELERARTQLKSALIMQGESTSARAATLAGDWYHLHRLRSLSELSDAIDKVTADEVIAYLKDYPAENFTMVYIGPEPLDTKVLR